ncbi:Kinesin-like protein kif22 [Branchiostoma belcheri]|nr:Kinesin-like protein kif22 [Branchiostoma belcheri]
MVTRLAKGRVLVNIEKEERKVCWGICKAAVWPRTSNEKVGGSRAGLLSACEKTCGYTKGGPRKHNETCWWDETVEEAVKEKRRLFKVWQKGGSKEPYLAAKRAAKSEIYYAKKSAKVARFSNITTNDMTNQIFKLARSTKSENQYVTGEKCIKQDDGSIAFTEADKLSAWKCHYDRLLNVEFPWNPEVLDEALPVYGPPPKIDKSRTSKAINAMKRGKAAGPSGIVAEMLQAGGEFMADQIASLTNAIIKEERIPNDWNLSYIINCYKGKGDPLERGNYRGLKLLDQVLKVVEKVLEPMIREQVHIDEGLQALFRKA